MFGYEGWGWPLLHGFGGFLTLVITLVVLWAVVTAVRAMARSSASADEGGVDRSMAILRERYARGELTKEQFEQMRRDLA